MWEPEVEKNWASMPPNWTIYMEAFVWNALEKRCKNRTANSRDKHHSCKKGVLESFLTFSLWIFRFYPLTDTRPSHLGAFVSDEWDYRVLESGNIRTLTAPALLTRTVKWTWFVCCTGIWMNLRIMFVRISIQCDESSFAIFYFFDVVFFLWIDVS